MKLSSEQMKEIILSSLSEEEKEQIKNSIEITREEREANEKRWSDALYRLERLQRLTVFGAPSIILANELRMLCEEYEKVDPSIMDKLKYSFAGEE